MEEKKLFLLDAYALIYRAYYALIRSPRVTSSGFNTSAIFGFCNTLDEILRKENPSHIAVCFDPPGGHTFRHDHYEAYKAQRDKQPEDITASIPFIKEILQAYRIPAIEVEGFEADDVIGTLSRMAQAEGFVTYMMTPDKDYGQLVTDRVFMYRPALRGEGFEVRGPAQVCERYGISNPQQIIDLLALEGDASDNVPGCPGVGEKTAAKLIAQWGSVDNLIEHVDQLKGALKTKVEQNIEQIRMSKWLVTIKTDVPLGTLNPDSLERKTVDVDKLLDIYRRLEFRTFIKRFTRSTLPADGAQSESTPRTAAPAAPGSMGSLFDLPDTPSANPSLPLGIGAKTLQNVDHTYSVAADNAEAARFIDRAATLPEVGIAINANGPEAMSASIHGLAVSLGNGEAFYLPISGSDPELTEIIVPLFSGNRTVVSTDIKRDYLLLRRLGIIMECPYFDTAVAHYLISPETKHNPEKLALAYLDYEMIGASTASSPLPADHTATCERASVAIRLKPLLEQEIKQASLLPLLTDIELPLIKVLAEMEWTGVRIDSVELAKLSQAYTLRLNAMEERAYTLAGGKFNVASPMQVGEVLFDRLKIDPKAKRTKKGAYSTTEEILEKYRHDHEIVDLILKIRALRKLLATYINALPALVNPRTGRIHTSYNQTVTATGRLSSTNPNLQNIPVRSDDGREIRRAFVADPGDLLLSADYSQIELRLMAHLSNDPNMVEAFLSGADIHRATAAKINHLPLDEVNDTQRRAAKTANFGIIYGISAFGLSERLGIPRGEAKDLISGYFRTYPGVKDYMDRSIETAREHKYVTTVKGRKRMLPDIDSRSAVVRGYAERNAINAPLQGSAADIIKIAMVNIFNEMARLNLRSRMIMQVHDELIFNVVPDELSTMQELVKRLMETAFTARVPLEVSMGLGHNWLEAH
ncbi:MAG: DNA polymerase I [Bacteroides sp.]|nr:DNA polymerase I [Bacteroides sp.]